MADNTRGKYSIKTFLLLLRSNLNDSLMLECRMLMYNIDKECEAKVSAYSLTPKSSNRGGGGGQNTPCQKFFFRLRFICDKKNSKCELFLVS